MVSDLATVTLTIKASADTIRSAVGSAVAAIPAGASVTVTWPAPPEPKPPAQPQPQRQEMSCVAATTQVAPAPVTRRVGFGPPPVRAGASNPQG